MNHLGDGRDGATAAAARHHRRLYADLAGAAVTRTRFAWCIRRRHRCRVCSCICRRLYYASPRCHRARETVASKHMLRTASAAAGTVRELPHPAAALHRRGTACRSQRHAAGPRATSGGVVRGGVSGSAARPTCSLSLSCISAVRRRWSHVVDARPPSQFKWLAFAQSTASLPAAMHPLLANLSLPH